MAPAHAGERESLEQLRATTLGLIQALVDQGILNKDKADALIQQAQANTPAEPATSASGDAEQAGDAKDGKAPVRVQYVPEFVKNQLRDEIKKEVMAKLNYKAGERLGLPEWIDRISWEGDLRLRYENDKFPDGNETPQNLNLQGAGINNTSEDRERYRVRARLGANIKISDDFSGGIRLVTGNASDPVSPNQTVGMNNGSGNSKYNFALDRAFLKYKPNDWLSVTGGRFANPWMNTDLVWDPDLSFDGVAASLTPKVNDRLRGFFTAGIFPIEEVESSSNNGTSTVKAKDKWLYGAQAGIEFGAVNETKLKLAAAFYDFSNVTGVQNDLGSTTQNLTAPRFRQRGNTVFNISNPLNTTAGPFALASEFRELNLTGELDIVSFDPVHVILTGDYVRNLAFDEKEVLAKSPVSPVGGDTGWMGKIQVGMPTTLKRDDWNVFAAYKHLETNAVLDAFTDSDFHLGGTNAKGWIAGANYGVDKNTWLSLRWLSADEIVGSPFSVDVLLLDLNAKF